MLKNISFIFLFIISITTSFAQKNYFDGYVILQKNDTVYGKIKDRKPGSFGSLYVKIKFKPYKGHSKKYNADDILGYKSGKSIFESKWFKNTNSKLYPSAQSSANIGDKRFLKLITKGYLSYYYDEYYNEDGNLDAIGYFKRDNQAEMVFVRTGIFGVNKKQLITYFDDCPELQNQLRKKTIKTPKEILNFYNDWFKKNTPH